MRPILISPSDADGGANRAAFRLHKAFLENGVNSQMHVGIKKTDMESVVGPQKGLNKIIWGKIRPGIGNLIMRLQKTNNPIPRSSALLPSGIVSKLNSSKSDVINLNAFNGEFFSIEDVGCLRKPVVLTLHDMWAFCGAEHYTADNIDARWRMGYLADNRPKGDQGLDIDRWVWRRKVKAWDIQMHIVAPSRWLADCVKSSSLLRGRPVSVIPNLLDTRQFQPYPKSLARQILGLPQEGHIVLFGAVGGGAVLNKGWDLLQSALVRIAQDLPGITGVIFGQSAPANPPKLGLPLHWMGYVSDDVTLARLYSAADVMVVPSRIEAFGQTASEAQSCGCPVVAFNCTGLVDIVEHEATGYLAKPYDSEDLANGIKWILEDNARYLRLSENSRKRALRLWDQEVVVPQYLEVYKQVINNFLP